MNRRVYPKEDRQIGIFLEVSVNDGAANIPGSVSVAADGLSATFNPDVDLVNDVAYTVVATSGITDPNGNPLTQDFSSTFNTEAAPLPDTPMHVVSIDVSLDQKGPNWQARAWVKVVDDTGAVVELASVTGTWTFKGNSLNSLTTTTTSEGIANLNSTKVKEVISGDVFAFTVEGVSKIGFIYEPGANVETSDSVAVP